MKIIEILTFASLILVIFKLKKIMGSQQDAADKLTAIGAQLAKANTEIQTKIQELTDAAGNADNVDPALQAAIDALVPAAQTLDDIVPDAPEGDGGEDVPPAE